jgi:hypothetical protein
MSGGGGLNKNWGPQTHEPCHPAVPDVQDVLRQWIGAFIAVFRRMLIDTKKEN